jgi:hypothetical protein
MDRDAWRAAGQAHLAAGRLRRALGAFRRALELDLRGEQSFELHQLISVATQVLSQRGAYYLHPSDETMRSKWLEAGSAPLAQPDFAGLAAEAKTLGLGELETLFLERTLSPGLADQDLTVAVSDRGADFKKQARAAQLWLYEALLLRDEPLTSA